MYLIQIGKTKVLSALKGIVPGLEDDDLKIMELFVTVGVDSLIVLHT